MVVVAFALMSATAAMAVIKDSKHDLSSTSLNGGIHANNGVSACQFCHTPHLGTNPSVVGAPLWNRSISGAADYTAAGGGVSYRVYGAASAGIAGVTLGTTVVNAPGPNSKTCLSCHDGTLALGDVLVGADSTAYTDPSARLTGGMLTSGPGALTTDLTNEHPVGFTVVAGRGGTDTVVNMEGHGAKFYSGTMECGTCHDPHMTGDATRPKFMRMVYSTKCTDCHVSK